MHGLIAVWKCHHVYKSSSFYFLLIPVLSLLPEGIYTVGIRPGHEYKLISPCIALYLGSLIPAIWCLELKLYFDKHERHFCQDTRAWLKNPNITSSSGCDFTFAKETRENFAIERTIEQFIKDYEITSYTFNEQTKMKSRMREFIKSTMLENCEKIARIFPGPVPFKDDTGKTLWKSTGKCIREDSYGDDGITKKHTYNGNIFSYRRNDALETRSRRGNL